MLIFSLTISVLFMIFLPIVFAVVLRRRFQVPWLLFALGTVTVIASQAVHLPLNDLLTRLHILPANGINDPAISLLQTSLVLGLTAAVCEETARAVGFWLVRRSRGLPEGVMFGLGHGGVEAMVFGGVLTAATAGGLIPLIGTDLAALKLAPEQLKILTSQLQVLNDAPLWAAAAPLLERLLAMAIHVTLSVMVLQAFRQRSPLFYLAAVAYHLVFDAAAVYAAASLPDRNLVLPILLGLLLPGLAWLGLTWRKEAPPAAVQPAPVSADLDSFLAATAKELLQQWRTNRFLVVNAVFVLFGLTSPLLAKFTPEILKSVAGAEQFAALVPTPTTADAMAQYIKNLTQFGFILAVLLGMSAVAGEKEAGTAAMILSKPLPRWAFVLSKFSAQVVVYVSAFGVSGLGAYYYTLLLFGSFDPVRFLGINLLLLEWLLAFVAAAVLGSVVGPTTVSAAGIGLGLAVALLLAGSIPNYGQLLPSGLMGWASQLGANADKILWNTGALAGGVVLITLFLTWSVALFERQEI